MRLFYRITEQNVVSEPDKSNQNVLISIDTNFDNKKMEIFSNSNFNKDFLVEAENENCVDYSFKEQYNQNLSTSNVRKFNFIK